jgi:CRP-like cAMP-binding protein
MPVLQNLGLRNLPADILQKLGLALHEHEFPAGKILFMPGDSVRHLFFMTSGAVSLVTPLAGGETIEFAIVGRDSLIGGMAALGSPDAFYQAIVQVDGAGYSLEVEAARRLVHDSEAFRTLIARNEQFILTQAQQSSACNALHNLEQRLARWLLRVRDATGSDTFKLTQDFMSEMLGVRRTSVSVVAGKFQQAGWISYVRGHVRLERPDALEHCACECYRAVRSQHEILLEAEPQESKALARDALSPASRPGDAAAREFKPQMRC